jgi:hypothetical protein
MEHCSRPADTLDRVSRALLEWIVGRERTERASRSNCPDVNLCPSTLAGIVHHIVAFRVQAQPVYVLPAVAATLFTAIPVSAWKPQFSRDKAANSWPRRWRWSRLHW